MQWGAEYWMAEHCQDCLNAPNTVNSSWVFSSDYCKNYFLVWGFSGSGSHLKKKNPIIPFLIVIVSRIFTCRIKLFTWRRWVNVKIMPLSFWILTRKFIVVWVRSFLLLFTYNIFFINVRSNIHLLAAHDKNKCVQLHRCNVQCTRINYEVSVQRKFKIN